VFFQLSEKQPVVLSNQPIVLLLVLNQVCSSFEEFKSFEFDGRLDVLVVAEVL